MKKYLLQTISNMNLLRNILALIFLILIIITLFFVDYSDLSWHTNRGNYIGILSGILGIFTIVVSARRRNEVGKKQKLFNHRESQ
jgi:hypothetical protein